MPALAVAVALTFTRSAMVGACAAAALLLALKDFRLLAVLPIVAALFFALAPASITARYVRYSIVKDPTNRSHRDAARGRPAHDRRQSAARRRTEHGRTPVRGVPRSGRVEQVNPHLHNVPVQIAAERGLPALAVWLWFVGIVIVDLRSRASTPARIASSPRPRSRRSPRCSPPACSSTTSATPSS